MSKTIEELKQERDAANALWLKANNIAKTSPEAIEAERLWGEYRIADLTYEAAYARAAEQPGPAEGA